MSQKTSFNTKSAKLTNNVKLGYRTTHADTGKGRSSIWSCLVLFVAFYIIATTLGMNSASIPQMDNSSEMSLMMAQVPMISSDMPLDSMPLDGSGLPLSTQVDALPLTPLALLYVCAFLVHRITGNSEFFNKYMSGSFLSRKHLITIGKLRDENGEVPVRYNTNVRFNSLTRGIKCQKKFGFFGHVVNNEQVFYDVPEFPTGF